MEKFQITKEGYQKLKSELDNLKMVERPRIITAIAEARELGDLKENAEYHSAKDKQGLIEAQIADLENKFSRAEVINISDLKGDNVQFGATVKLENLDNGKMVTYKIVSEFEADIDNGLISVFSPVARFLLGKKSGDEVEIKTPGGVSNYEIIDVKFV
ncbi:MAG: transcription elongation factor GreA [Rickettsiales bacterium]|nr:transcription elongation factor GreA [Rickettsiales bacterium]